MKYYLYILFALLLSCSAGVNTSQRNATYYEEKTSSPPTYRLMEGLFQHSDPVFVKDVRGFQEPVELIKFLIPMAYQWGYHQVQWDILTETSLSTFQDVIQAETFSEEKAIGALKELSYKELQQRNLDLLRYLWNFNQQLSNDVPPLTFVGSGDQTQTLVFTSKEGTPLSKSIFLYGFDDSPNGHEDPSLAMEKLYQGENNFILASQENGSLWFCFYSPKEFQTTEYLLKEVTSKDIPDALEDFPRLSSSSPHFWAAWRIRSSMRSQERQWKKSLRSL